jgi:indolepyruvate ferredoxin oxidoreductase beta subunit
MPQTPSPVTPVPTTDKGRMLARRIEHELPEPARANAMHGVARLMDYQDAGYAALYLDRLGPVVACDAAPFALTTETARHLALWMSYEDTIRVADLKTRGSRVSRVRGEVKAQDDQLLGVTEFMHPRLREICEMLPTALGRGILASPALSRVLGRLFTKGRHVETTSLRWFVALRAVAAMRGLRPRSLRYGEEQARIEAWLQLVVHEAAQDLALALELVRCQRLIKGYGETFERGLGNFEKIVAEHRARPLAAQQVRQLHDLALADDTSTAFAAALAC